MNKQQNINNDYQPNVNLNNNNNVFDLNSNFNQVNDNPYQP